MRSLKIGLVMLGLTCMVILTQGLGAEAFEANFSVRALIPDNQVSSNQSFFDIKLDPGAHQVLEVVLTNHSDEEVIVSQSVNTATTNSNGVVEYAPNDREPDRTLSHPFEEIARINAEEVILAPQSETIVKIEVELPETTFEGMLLGGIFLQESMPEQVEKEQQGVQIHNHYAYVIAIQIEVGDVEDIRPMLELNDIMPTQLNRRNTLTANLQNIHPVGIRELSVEARVYQQGSEEVYREARRENMRMAPNSNFNLPISWGYKAFEDGTYVLHLTAEADGEVWTWEEEFVIENSDEINENALIDEIEDENESTALWPWLIGATAGVSIPSVWIWLKRKGTRLDA